MRDKTYVGAPLDAPYDQVWAVAPLVNESGVSIIDALTITDLLREEAERVRGIETIPVQRTLEAMRAMDIGRVQSPGEAETLARLLGADGILVGVINSYDPYYPPKLGLAIQLYPAELAPHVTSLDLRRLEAAATDDYAPTGEPVSAPYSGVSEVVDAADNGVRLNVQSFARGRTDANTALNWERYLYVMDLYTQFVCHRLLDDLLYQERLRVLRSGRTLTTESPSPSA